MKSPSSGARRREGAQRGDIRDPAGHHRLAGRPQPVFDLIARKAAELCSGDFGAAALRQRAIPSAPVRGFPRRSRRVCPAGPHGPSRLRVGRRGGDGRGRASRRLQTAQSFAAATARSIGWRPMLGVPVRCGTALGRDRSGLAEHHAASARACRSGPEFRRPGGSPSIIPASSATCSRGCRTNCHQRDPRGISRSPDDDQPVFETIVEIALRLSRRG